MQNFEIQLAALEEFKSFLEQFCDELGDKVIMYGNKFNSAREAGLSVQIAENYASNYCIPNMDKLSKITATIKEYDIPYINGNIVGIKEAIDIARRG
jgi:hypothetical protein